MLSLVVVYEFYNCFICYCCKYYLPGCQMPMPNHQRYQEGLGHTGWDVSPRGCTLCISILLILCYKPQHAWGCTWIIVTLTFTFTRYVGLEIFSVRNIHEKWFFFVPRFLFRWNVFLERSFFGTAEIWPPNECLLFSCSGNRETTQGSHAKQTTTVHIHKPSKVWTKSLTDAKDLKQWKKAAVLFWRSTIPQAPMFPKTNTRAVTYQNQNTRDLINDTFQWLQI